MDVRQQITTLLTKEIFKRGFPILLVTDQEEGGARLVQLSGFIVHMPDKIESFGFEPEIDHFSSLSLVELAKLFEEGQLLSDLSEDERQRFELDSRIKLPPATTFKPD